MIRKKLTAIMVLAVAMGGLMTGCVGYKQARTPVEPLTCSQALGMGIQRVSDTDLAHALDTAMAREDLGCWERLIAKALEHNRVLDLTHLGFAVHHFNKNETEELFSQAVHAYFTGMIIKQKPYEKSDQDLMKAFVSFEIQRAHTKNDDRLNRAREVCRELDSGLYQKYFL